MFFFDIIVIVILIVFVGVGLVIFLTVINDYHKNQIIEKEKQIKKQNKQIEKQNKQNEILQLSNQIFSSDKIQAFITEIDKHKDNIISVQFDYNHFHGKVDKNTYEYKEDTFDVHYYTEPDQRHFTKIETCIIKNKVKNILGNKYEEGRHNTYSYYITLKSQYRKRATKNPY